MRVPKSLAIRRGQWKYLEHAGSGGNRYLTNPELKAFSIPDNAPSATGQLYDLQADPGEVTNLALAHPEIAAELGLHTFAVQGVRTWQGGPLK